MKDQMLLALLKALPRKTVSRWMGRFARTSASRRLIPYYIRRFDVDLSEVEKPTAQYPTLLDFFVRGLKEGARPVDPDPSIITSPVDGTVSQKGKIDNGTLLQAKGITYRLEDLLGRDQEKAARYNGGHFITLYLSPRDYHRIHTPIQGKVIGLTYIPGTLFPVNALGVQRIKGIFARNERLITYLETDAGRVAVVKVGATNVGSIRVTYDPGIGTNRPRKKQVVKRDYPNEKTLGKGEEMGRFEFGSTVILLFESNRIEWVDHLNAGTTVRMGEPIAHYST
ncbi:archaetidylserine decarboxylase [Salinithrix halophila]|uniref:Phosphatidylserine decarboxylase proenzyme n=1 Tax=Salinithrix halophila TaxID=1485204 RepID=A0ABV8JDQ5_9BACL